MHGNIKTAYVAIIVNVETSTVHEKKLLVLAHMQ